ncbi:MAG: YcxB family protein [Filimonas sp.]|nr:YcxB family protein [Filimonas sp.]
MQFPIAYDKKKVIQGLRYHFITRPEIKVLIILVNVFAIVAGILFYMKKIRPEPFLLGSVLWLIIMIAFWYLLPWLIYRRSETFRDKFIISFQDKYVGLENERGAMSWKWETFSSFFESPNFFHLYFNTRSFFIVPKENMTEDMRHELRGILNQKIGKK